MHPSDLELDAQRTGSPDPHVAGCADCQARLADLRALAGVLSAPLPTIAVPAAQDAALLALARGRGAAIVKKRRIFAVAAPVLFAAAAAIAIYLVAARPARELAREDVNRDGAVDILDAFTLARAVDAQTTSIDWDFNHDGTVDRADVTVLSNAAVSVRGGG